MSYRLVLFILLCFALAPRDAEATEQRVALVLGNSEYKNTAQLQNPRHDAHNIAQSLKRLGFDVIEGIDLDKRSMERMIRQFGMKLMGADIALFFYAGHALQVSGQNYMLPTDARLASEADIDFEAIALHLVLKQMEREARTSLVLLDACRDNPLARNLARAMGTRSGQVSHGLAEVKTGVGTLIGFSTQPGNVALDGTGQNSPYSAALLNHIEASGVDFSTTLINVRNDVVKVTKGQQVPWEHTSLMKQVVLSAPTLRPSAKPDVEIEVAFWNTVRESKSPQQLRQYLERFPNGYFADVARMMIDQLEREAIAQKDKSRRDEQVKRAEEGKLLLEQKEREAAQRAAEERAVAPPRKARVEEKRPQVRPDAKSGSEKPPAADKDMKSFSKKLCDWGGVHSTMHCF